MQSQPYGYCGERAEFGADDHRADDSDRGVGRDADRGQQACQHHERHEYPGQRRVFASAGDDLVPDDCISGIARRVALGAAHTITDRSINRVQAD